MKMNPSPYPPDVPTGYASRTGTKRNLEALRTHGWRLLVSATGVWRTEGFAYGIDNGAWTSYQKGEPWDEGLFKEVVDKLACDADFVIAPDIVMGGLESLRLTERWLSWMSTRVRLSLVPVQDGMNPADIRPLLGNGMWVGIFVGGSTQWKEKSIRMWSELAHDIDCYIHVGRVNSARRIKMCAEAGVDSFDGTSVTRYASNIKILDRARFSVNKDQISMF